MLIKQRATHWYCAIITRTITSYIVRSETQNLFIIMFVGEFQGTLIFVPELWTLFRKHVLLQYYLQYESKDKDFEFLLMLLAHFDIKIFRSNKSNYSNEVSKLRNCSIVINTFAEGKINGA